MEDIWGLKAGKAQQGQKPKEARWCEGLPGGSDKYTDILRMRRNFKK